MRFGLNSTGCWINDGRRVHCEQNSADFIGGESSGLDVMVKDRKRFANTNGWGFFTFGHHPPPYAETASAASVLECASCHIAYVSKTDMVYVQS